MARRGTLRIATFNVNGVVTRLAQVLAWLDRAAPDIVALQELKCTDAAFPVQAFEDAGYGALWLGEKSWNGVAILGRGVQPLESRRSLPGGRDDSQSRYLEAAVHGVLVGALYLPNGNPRPGPKFDYKLAWMARLLRHARTLVELTHPVALVGDYNVIPTDADVYDAKAWRRDALIQPEVREAFEALVAQGWVDALARVHPDATPYTFWDYFRQHAERDRGLRIDHLLLNPRLASGLADAGVDRWVRLQDKASDHAPTWAEVAAPAGGGKAPVAAAKRPVAARKHTAAVTPGTNSRTAAKTSSAATRKRAAKKPPTA